MKQIKFLFNNPGLCWLLCNLCLFSSDLCGQESFRQSINTDSLEYLLQTEELTGRERLQIYNELSWHYMLAADPERIMDYSQKGIALGREINDLYGVADLYNNLAVGYDYLGQFDSAMYCFEQALDVVRLMEEQKTESDNRIALMKGMTYGSIANLYSIQGDLLNAVENYFKAILLFEACGDRKELSVVYGNLGETYMDMNNYEQAEFYYAKKEAISREINHVFNLAHALTGLANIYLTTGKYAEALAHAEEANGIYTEYSEQPDMRISNLNNLASIWLNGYNDDKKAMVYAGEALTEAKELGLSLDICRALHLISEIYYQRGDYSLAEKNALEALSTDSSHPATNILLYEIIARSNVLSGNKTKALDYMERYKQAGINLSNHYFQSTLTEMEVRYETEKKEMRITALEDERKLMIWLGLAGIAILWLVLLLFLFLWRWTVQKKRVVEQQHQLVAQQVKQLEQEKQLIASQATLDGETAERTRLARDLHDGLGSMLTGIKLNLESMKEDVASTKNGQNPFSQALAMINESMTELRRVAHHLMPESLSRYGLKIALTDFCDNFPSVEFDYFGSEERLEPKIEVMIYRAIYELVNNALKHSGATQIMVQVMCETDYIAFIVRDNGCGFNPASGAKGMGLRNIYDRIASYNGRIDIDSRPGEGTEVNGEWRVDN